MEHHLQQLLERLNVNCVVDVGARFGDYGALCRRLGYEGRIVSVEPATDSYRVLSERACGDDRWIVIQAALGSSSERRALNIAAFTSLNSFLERNEYNLSLFGDAGRVVEREVVDVQRLDSVLPAYVADLPEPCLFLKIDTQGWDIEVLRGAGRVLPLVVALHVELAVRPIYEGAVTYLEALHQLEAAGFELSGLFPGGFRRWRARRRVRVFHDEAGRRATAATAAATRSRCQRSWCVAGGFRPRVGASLL